MLSHRDDFLRVVLFLAALLGAFFAPFWVPLLCMILLSLRFRAWEALFIGLLMDLLWLPSVGFFNPFPYFTVGAIILVWIFEPVRKEFLIS